jgi:glutathione S-transferase
MIAYRLHYFPESGNSYKLALMLTLCGVRYLFFPKDESGYDLAASHPAVQRWLDRIAALPGWRAPYELLPGKHLRRYA